MKHIFVAGSAAYDEIMDFPSFFKDYFHPEKLHQINVSFVVRDLAKHLGGIATNISYSLSNTLNFYNENLKLDSRLRGNDTENKNDTYVIYPVAAVGRDGGELLEFFKKNNIDTTYIQQDEKLYTATGKVITDKNDNQIWGFYYGASSLKPKLKTLNTDRTNDFWIISATHERPFTTVLQYVIKNKLPYLFDPGMTLTWIGNDLLKKGVMNAAYVVGNDYEIAMIEKRMKMTVKEMVEKGVSVITTLGDKGVNYFGSVIPVKTEIQSINFNLRNDNSRLDFPASEDFARLRGNDTKKYMNKNLIFIPAIKLKKVIDPTGAGDAWRGGFVGALVAGKPIKECLIMGNVMASFAVESVGTVEYTVSTSEIIRRIKSISK